MDDSDFLHAAVSKSVATDRADGALVAAHGVEMLAYAGSVDHQVVVDDF